MGRNSVVEPEEAALVFVYNADSGPLNALLDAAHRIMSPSTYPCRLCALTYSYSGMREDWRAFVRQLGLPVEFLHRDELRAESGVKHVALPAVLIRRDRHLEELVGSAAINASRDLEELKGLVASRLPSLAALHGA